MVAITVGVPVYNGGDLLDEALACLARQTLRDFKVIICDNASTDATPEIAAHWAACDSRFIHFRQKSNIGGMGNFATAVQAATSPWFLWRADDDLSDDNYLEKLFGLASSAVGCRLAVSTVVSHDLDGGRRKVSQPPSLTDPTSTQSRLRTLFGYHPSWVYGLWDTRTIQSVFAGICSHYPIAYASDHLTLYGPIIDGAVRTTAETKFIQRMRRVAATPRRQTRMSFSLMVKIRREVRGELRRMRAERRLSPQLHAALVAVEPFYLQRVVPKMQKMARTRLREWLGIAGKSGSLGRHFERTALNDSVQAPGDDSAPGSGV